jgi:LuxR family maltose regulon positive regulatory protein
MAIWTGEFDEGERWLRRAWEVSDPSVDPAATVLLHVATGMLHAGRGEHRSALEAFAAAGRMESQLSGVHALAPRIAGWLAAAQARLGIPDEARATLTRFSGEPEQIGLIYDGQMGAIYNARAVIFLTEGHHEAALDALRGVLDATPPAAPSFTVVESHLLAGPYGHGSQIAGTEIVGGYRVHCRLHELFDRPLHRHPVDLAGAVEPAHVLAQAEDGAA